MTLRRRTMVAITTEEASPGVPLWGKNQIIQELPDGETHASFENLIAGRTYYVRSWNEDAFGNKSPELLRVIQTPPDQTVPATPTGLALAAGEYGFQASWSAVADADVAEYDLSYAPDNGSGTAPTNSFTTISTRATQVRVDATVGVKYWAKVRSRDYSGNASEYSSLVAVQPTKTIPVAFSANGFLDSGSPMRAYVKVPAVQSVVSALVTLAFRQFMAPATSVPSSGTLTSATDGGTTTPSGGGSTSGSSQDGVTLSGGGTNGTTGPASAGTAHTHNAGSIATNDNAVIALTGHTHSTPSHTHGCPDHSHSIAGHTHALNYGTFEESFPASHSVKVKTYKRVGGSWTLQDTSASLTGDLEDLDLSAVITGAGDWRLEVLSDAAQPNGGRLGCDLYGTLTVVI